MTETETGIVATSNFKHSVALPSGSINHAIHRGGYIYVNTARPRGFAVVSTQGEGKIVAQWEVFKVLGGMFSGSENKIYAPLQNRLFRLGPDSSTELLEDRKGEMVGVKDVAIYADKILIVSHNGFFVFHLPNLEQVASFVNHPKAVSPISMLLAPDARRLYLANLYEQPDTGPSLMALDAADDFRVLWKTTVRDSFSASAGEYPVGRLLMAGGKLICPVIDSDSRQHRLEFRDPATGVATGEVDVHSNRHLYSDGKFVYIMEFKEGTAAALDPMSGSVKWTSEIGSGTKGPFRAYRDKLYLYGPDKQTTVIDKASGTSNVVSQRLNFHQALDGNLNRSERFYTLDDKFLCWD